MTNSQIEFINDLPIYCPVELDHKFKKLLELIENNNFINLKEFQNLTFIIRQ